MACCWEEIASRSPSRLLIEALRLVTLFALHFFHTDNIEEREAVDVESVLRIPCLEAETDGDGRWP